MAIKHNKLDFTEFSRKGGRQVSPVYSGLFQIASQRRQHRAKLNFWPAAPVILGGLLVVLLLQGFSYLSSARKTSTQILGAATSAYTQLKDGSRDLTNQNFSSAQSLFGQAQYNIQIAQKKLSNFGLLRFLAPPAQSADRLLAGAANLAAAGDKLSLAFKMFDDLKVSSQGTLTANANETIAANRQLLAEAKGLVDQASEEFNSVAAVPADYADTLASGKQQVAQLSSLLKQLIGLEDLYLGFFGSTPHTYLAVFQNYDEARATGGFIGTYGVLKTASGKINSLKISSVYDLDGRIFEPIAAPGPLQPAIKRWGLRDANWFADFPTSANKLLRFFELGGETADGVIAFTPQIFGELLELTGPIDMPEYNVTLTPENFQQTVQFETSADYDRALNQPKKFLADFAPIFLDRLADLRPVQWLGLFQALEDSLRQKQILLYSKDPVVQTTIDNLGFSGKILAADLDYLNIVNTNLGGTKTDLNIIQMVNLSAKILSDGAVLNTVVINRTSQAWEANKDFIRILLPLGSQLISASGFDQYDFHLSASRDLKIDPDLAAWDQGVMNSNVFVRQESGKTEFSGWLTVKAGENRSVTISYILPFKVRDTYSLLLQKQNGSKPYEFSGRIDLGGRSAAWASGGLNFESNLTTDDFWGIVFE